MIRFDETERLEGLECPGCGDRSGTHMDTVYAITREGEDAKPHALRLSSTGVVTDVEWDDYPTTLWGDTGRRHEFVLTGWCETCGAIWSMTFRQHKGATLTALRVSGGDPA